MAARGRELQRSARALLPSDVREIGVGWDVCMARRRRRVRVEFAAEIRDRVGEVPNRNRLHARERRLEGRLVRTEQTFEAQASGPLGDGEPAAPEDDEIDAVGWFLPDDLDGLNQSPATRSILADLLAGVSFR